MSEPHGVGGDVVRSEAVVGELGWCVGVRWGVFGIGEWVGLSGGGGDGGGGVLQTTSGSSVCGQSGCQALGLWIAGDC